MLSLWNFSEIPSKSERLQRHVRGFTYTLTLPTVQELISSESPPLNSLLSLYQNLDTSIALENLTIPLA